MDAIYEPISLGHACDTKYQIARALFFRERPGASEARFELYMRDRTSLPRHMFDWQITPLTAVCEYIERDFVGVFEREDLTFSNETCDVVHRGLGARFPHDFGEVEGVLSEAEIDERYPAARAKFDHLARKFRTLLTTPGPYLYMFREIPPLELAERLIACLSRHPEHRFRVLFLDDHPKGDFSSLPMVETRTISLDPQKPPGREWQGNDASWAQALADLPLGRHGAPAKPAVAAVAGPAPARGLMGGLLSRLRGG